MTANIEIDGLRLLAYHGVMPQERKVGNIFEVSLSLEYPSALQACDNDRLEDTLNYAEVVEIVKHVMAEPSDLIEHVAGRIHSALISKYPDIKSGTITVSKLAPPISAEIKAVRFTLRF